ncbi:MAG: hypothetical protein WAX38_04525 [Minisyncoccia bacterium]
MTSIDFLHPLESGTREEGLRRFLALLPKVIERLDPKNPEHLGTLDGLKLMHRITTHGSTKPWPDRFAMEAAAILITQDNPDVLTIADQKSGMNAILTKMKVLERKQRKMDEASDGPSPIPYWRGKHEVKFATSARNGKAVSTQFQIGLRRQGAFRSQGARIDADGTKTEMPATHTVEIFDRFVHTNKEPEYYLGMLDNVGDLMARIAAWRDEGMRRAKNIDQYLTVVVFFSIMGSKIIHPFFDGNGRAFEAQIIKDLHLIGYPVDRMPYLTEYEPMAKNALETISNEYLHAFMQKHKIPYIPHSYLPEVQMNPKLRRAYTHMLSNAIRTDIGAGIPDGYLGDLVINAVNTLKMSLSRDVGTHASTGTSWGPPPESPFYIGRVYYDIEAPHIKEQGDAAPKPVRTRE